MLGFTHPNAKAAEGLAVGDAYLTYLATHPATAKRIAHKLARRFVCDDPPQTLVDRLAQSYLDNGTAIVPMLRTLFRSVEFWMSTGLKTRRPLEKSSRRPASSAWRQARRPARPGGPVLDDEPARPRAAELGAAGRIPRRRRRVGLGARDARHMERAPRAHPGLAPGRQVPRTRRTSSGSSRPTVGAYLDTLAQRLVHQPMRPAHKQALLKFLGAKESTKVRDVRLGGKIEQLVPLVLDSVYHALR